MPKKKPKSKVQPRGRLEKIYKPHTRMARKQKREPEKGRKRSASASPVLRHRKTSPGTYIVFEVGTGRPAQVIL